MSYSTRIKLLESQIKKLEDSLNPKLKPVFYCVLDEGGKVKLPDGREVRQSELRHLQMQGLYREYKIIQVRFIGDDNRKQSYAIQESPLQVEPQNPLPTSPTDTGTRKLSHNSIINTNPPNEPTPATPSLSSPNEHQKRPSSTSPLAELFK